MSLLVTTKETLLPRVAEELEADALYLQLPLPDVDAARLKVPASDTKTSKGNGESDGELRFYNSTLSSAASVFVRRRNTSKDLRGQAVEWRVSRDNRSIQLQALDIGEAKSSNAFPARKIVIASQLPLFRHCVTLCEDAKNDCLVVDVIVQPGFLYTLAIPFDQFYLGLSRMALSDANASAWRSIKFPYNFDLRRPHMLHAVSPHMLVVSIVDGSLIQFVRNSSLEDISWKPFQDQHKGLSLSSLLPWSSGDQVPGHPNISANTVISMDSIIPPTSRNDNAPSVVTVSINRSVKVWCLNSLTVLSEHKLEEDSSPPSAEDKTILLDPTPTRLVAFTKHQKDVNKASLPHTLLATYCPLTDGRFKIWQFNYSRDSGVTMVDLGAYFEVPPAPPGDSTSIWFVADFTLITFPSYLKLLVAWKSDTSLKVHSVSIPTKQSSKKHQWTAANLGRGTSTAYSSDYDLLGNISIKGDESEDFLNRILGPEGYSKATVEAALPIYSQHYGVDDAETYINKREESLATVSLREVICQTVGSAVSLSFSSSSPDSGEDFTSYRRDLHLQWVRFDRLCAELEKQGHEFLSLAYDEHQDYLWVSKASLVSLVHTVTPIELLYFNRSPAPSDSHVSTLTSMIGNKNVPEVMVKRSLLLLEALYSFRRVLPTHVRSDMLAALQQQFTQRELFLTSDRIGYMFDTIVDARISEASALTLLNSLAEVEDLDSVVSTLYLLSQEQGAQETGKNLSFTKVGATMVHSLLSGFASTYRAVYFDIIFLLVLSTSENLVGEFIANYSKFFQLFKTSSAELDLIGSFIKENRSTGDESFLASVQRLSVTDSRLATGSDPFERRFVPEYVRAHHRVSTSLISSLINVHQHFDTGNDLYLAAAVVDFHLRERSLTGSTTKVLEFVRDYAPDNYFFTFIRGNLLLTSKVPADGQKALILLRSAAMGLATTKVSGPEVATLIRLSPSYQNTLGQGLAKYYYAVAKAASERDNMGLALSLGENAVDFLSGDEDWASEMYWDLLTYSVGAHDFASAYQALIELNLCGIGKARIASGIEKLIVAMTASGKGLEFCKLPFIGLTDTVSDLLERLAKDPKRVADTRVPFYKLLYSWKLGRGDYQGAASALYSQLELLKSSAIERPGVPHPEHVTIMDLYTTTLNVLQCIVNESDRWIIAQKVVSDLPADGDVPKRAKLEMGTASSKGFYTRRVALSFAEIEQEHKDMLNQMERYLQEL